MTETGKKRSRIPRFRTREEAANFWDTHDSTEFEDEFRPTRVTFAKDVEDVLLVPLDAVLIDSLAEIGRDRGFGPAKLAAQLIAEGLDRMDAAPRQTQRKKGKQNG